MCLRRLPPDAPPCQSGEESAEHQELSLDGSTLPDYPKAIGSPQERRDQKGNARAQARRRLLHSKGEIERPLDLMPFGSTCPRSHPDRRAGTRYDSIELTTAQRWSARRLMHSADKCGRTYTAWTWWEGAGASAKEALGVFPSHCGTRACERCDSAIRKHECARVAGPWQMFLTFTMPRQPYSAREAWEKIHGWQKGLIRELRRESARRFAEDTSKTLRGHRSQMRRRKLAKDRIEGERKLQYAWVLEAHKDGFPHIHMCVNWSYIDYNFLRNVWRKTLKVKYANVQGDKVTSVDGACRYLSKYVSKGGLTLEILAIIKGRRAWATTNKKRAKLVSEKVQVKSISSDEAKRALDTKWMAFAGQGFAPDWVIADNCGIWKRASKPSDRASSFTGPGNQAEGLNVVNADYTARFDGERTSEEQRIAFEDFLERARAIAKAAKELADT